MLRGYDGNQQKNTSPSSTSHSQKHGRFGAGGFQQQTANMQRQAGGNFTGAMFAQNQQPQQQTVQAGQYSQIPTNEAVSIPGQFNPSAATGQPTANQSSTGQQNAYDQYATWDAAMQQQAANLVANTATQGVTPRTPWSNQVAQTEAPGANADLSSNYQNYLIQYQHQNANTSQYTLAAQGASNPTGVLPPNVPGAAGTPSSQAKGRPTDATPFNFPGYQQQLPQAAVFPFSQMNPAATQLPAMMGNSGSFPDSGAAANTSCSTVCQLYSKCECAGSVPWGSLCARKPTFIE